MALHRSLLLIAGLVVCGSSPACRGVDNAQQAAMGAAALAVNVPAALIVREATGDCYGVCSYGSGCNRKTGLCEPLEELPTKGGGSSTAPTFDERCSWAERDWAENSVRLGEQHPDMKALRRMIEKCVELRRDPDGARVAACGTLELDLAALGVKFAKDHPDVMAGQAALDQCTSHLTAETAGRQP